MQMSSNGEGVQKKKVKTASDLCSSGKEVELGKKEEPEKDVTEALLVLEKIQIEEKTSLGDVKRTESEQDIDEEQDVQNVLLLKVLNLAKMQRQKTSLKLLLLLKKNILMHKTEISVAFIPV